MRKRSSLSVKVLALVLCPLAFQLVFLVWIAKLERDADQQLSMSLHAEKISETINRLSSDIFDFAALCNTENAMNTLGSDAAFYDLQRKIAEHYEELRNLTKDNEEVKAIVAGSESAMHRMVDTSQKLKATENTEKEHQYRKVLWRSFRADLKNVLYGGLAEVAKGQKKFAQSSAEAQLALRAFSQNVAMSGALVTICFAAIIAVYFLKNVTNRLKVLNDNAGRLAAGAPLRPKLPGDDDIAFLDSTFHEMAAALQESARKEQAVVDNARDFICSLDKSGRFTSANPASRQLLGLGPDEILGSHLADYIADDRSVAQTFMKDLIKAGQMDNVSLALRRHDGVVLQTIWSSHWSEKHSSASCIVHDVSEQHAAQQLRRELVAMITHDLRTPLTTLNNVFTLLQRGEHCKMDEEGDRITSMATRQVEKMANLVNDLLDIDKINSGQMHVDLSKVLLDECFGACAENLKILARDKQIKLDFVSTKLMVLGEEEKIDRILTNLVANAIKFSPKGGTITVGVIDKDGLAYISVEDQGPGIPSDQFQTIFERFRQSDSSHSSMGSGLGLAICKAFVEVQNGKIWVENSSEKGTKFMFTLPLAVTAELA